MALSVLHKKSMYDQSACGVWDSERDKWVFNGGYDQCFAFKTSFEDAEQQVENDKWRQELMLKRQKMFPESYLKSF